MLIWFIAGERLLLDAAGMLMISSDNPLDFHCEIWLLLPILLKYLKTDWNAK